MTDDFNRFNSWKGLIYADRLQQLAIGRMVLPVNWHVYPSNLCNSACNFCIMKKERSNWKTMLSDSILLKMANDAHKLGVLLIHISMCAVAKNEIRSELL